MQDARTRDILKNDPLYPFILLPLYELDAEQQEYLTAQGFDAVLQFLCKKHIPKTKEPKINNISLHSLG